LKKIFWLAGENSGDLHAAEVLAELNKRGKQYFHFGIGGKKMEKQNFVSVFPFEKFSVMGFFEVLKHLPFFLKVESKIKEIFLKENPDLVILVDYPGLNMRVAKMASKMGIPVLYYICPQFWAWKRKRIYDLKKYTKHIAYILPFEKDFLRAENIDSTFVGHPIAEEIKIELSKEEFAEKYSLDLKKKWLGFLPGSRNTEVKKMLPVYFETIERFDGQKFEFLVSKAETIDNVFFRGIMRKSSAKIKIIEQNNYEMMKYCDFLVVTSGTATLETAFVGTPFIIVYKTSAISYEIGKRIVKINKIGLPNIVLRKDVVPELIQNEVNAERISEEIKSVLNSPTKYNEMANELREIRRILGGKSAAKETANIIEKMLNE